MFLDLNSLTPSQRLQKAVVSIMQNPRYVALAGVLMVGERCVDDSVPTACTNGRDEKYGSTFIESLNDPELRFLILHENYHKLYRHLTTWKKLYDICADTANRACDYVINIKIQDDNKDGFATMPNGGCIDPKYRGWDSAKVFWDLYNSEDSSSKSQGFDEHDWDGATALTDAEQQELARDIDQAVRQGALSAGKMGADVGRDLTELLEPQVDWREQLLEFVTDRCSGSDYSTWSRPNRRFLGEGVYMPSSVSESVGELVIGIDTSMSISQREINTFLSEVVGICHAVQPNKVRILYWDCDVASEEVYLTGEYDDIEHSTKPMGGGGTAPACVPKHIKDNGIDPSAVIMLTDGHIYNWGEWEHPLLWCITSTVTAPNGTSIHIKE